MKSISIIICTYNPEEEVFTRCLKAVKNLQIPEDTKVECVVVDNNSKQPVASAPYVQSLLNGTDWIEVISETKPGLSYARLAGCRHSSGDWIVFFDDDNEPDSDYLTSISSLENENPQVGVWGPARVRVVYLSEVDEWFHKNKHYFQERDYGKLLIDDSVEMKYFYPQGTGMIILSRVLTIWADKFERGEYSVLGRTAGNLESAEDLQILFVAIGNKYAVGSSPTLKLNHLTSAQKSNFLYIKRLAFGAGVSGPKLTKEMQGNVENYTIKLKSPATVNTKLLLFYGKYCITPAHKKLPFLVAYAKYFGDVVGEYRLMNKTLPPFLTFFINYFNFEKK
jgi:glycosyltransferase involved in cell wall biosynthesis